MSTADKRKQALTEVEACVCKDRQTTYGDPADHFADVAAMVTIVLGRKLSSPLEARDIASIQCCLKLCRLRTSPDHRDNWIDLAGYAVCGAGLLPSSQETVHGNDKGT